MATDVAYYYPAPYWHAGESEPLKSLLLFFDRISILLPGYMYGRHNTADPGLSGPLEDAGLLLVLEPEAWITEEVSNPLWEALTELITSGAFDGLPDAPHFAELSRSRMGYAVDIEIGDMLTDELIGRGLARPSEDGVSVPLHPVVRRTILVLLAQFARAAGEPRGLTMHPTTTDVRSYSELREVVASPIVPSVSDIIQLDVEEVGFDLSSVPLDDVLSFKAEHADGHTAYMRDLRRFMYDIAAVEDQTDRIRLADERQEELAEAAFELKRASRASLGKGLSSFALGIGGAAWSATTGDPFGFALGALGLVAPNLIRGADRPVSAYSYIIDVHRSFR